MRADGFLFGEAPLFSAPDPLPPGPVALAEAALTGSGPAWAACHRLWVKLGQVSVL